MSHSVLFLTLRTFSATGGIEKVCRVAGKALQDSSISSLTMYSLYDRDSDVNTAYVPATVFRGFEQETWRFIWQVFWTGRKKQIVILSHLNLLPAVFLLMLFAPRVKVMLFAHGIEVWKPLQFWTRWMMRRCWRVVSVSQYTKQVITSLHRLNPDRVKVLNNALDPLLPKPVDGPKSTSLLARYGFSSDHYVFLTVTRIASTEGYKGYDQVFRALASLRQEHPNIRYLLVGKYDHAEKARLDQLVELLGIKDLVVFAGFVSDSELAAHFHLADCYIMPSKKEGFGIVFIEALYYGKPVIAGNKDGSVDALANGTFGLLINPDDQLEISQAVEQMLQHPETYIPNPTAVLEKFGFETYQREFIKLLQSV